MSPKDDQHTADSRSGVLLKEEAGLAVFPDANLKVTLTPPPGGGDFSAVPMGSQVRQASTRDAGPEAAQLPHERPFSQSPCLLSHPSGCMIWMGNQSLLGIRYYKAASAERKVLGKRYMGDSCDVSPRRFPC